MFNNLQDLNMALLASLLHQFGLEPSEHMECFDRLGVGSIEVDAQLSPSGF